MERKISQTVKWLPRSLPYPKTTMYGAVKDTAEMFPEAMAYEFMGKKTSYRRLIEKADECAGAFLAAGIKRGDTVVICMPNVPQAVISLYGLNRIGAAAAMIHPLSSQKEITGYLDDSGAKILLTLDLFYEKAVKAREEAKNTQTVILTARIQEELYPHLALLYNLKKGKDYLKFPDQENSILWKDFLKNGKGMILPEMKYDPEAVSVLLYSGGTTGVPKGIMLTDYNFNVLGMQIREVVGIDFRPGLKFLSAMPIFHGFGLGIGIHTILENGAGCILVPQFTDESYAKLIVRKKPNFIAGVPTIYAALLKSEALKTADLSFLAGVFCGGDKLPRELKKEFDCFLETHHSPVRIREGYGLTECVTASCLTPCEEDGSEGIGVPLRDMIYRIVRPGTFEELPAGSEGEIIISGPTVMRGYLNHEEETAAALREDKNRTQWLFTGDLGYMDEKGCVYFTQRQKRMIISSGYNIYPSRVEDILEKHPDVDYCCVIGVPDERRMQRVRAYIVLKNNAPEDEAEKEKLIEHCRLYLAGYARPREIIFRKELPKTLVGKVAYHVLEEEAKL